MRDLILMALTGVISIAGLANPLIGMLAYTGYSLLGPHSQTWSFARTFPHVQTIAIATMVGYLLSARKSRVPSQLEMPLLIMLLVVFTLSTSMGLAPERANEDLIRMVKVIVMVLLSTLIINDERRLHLFMRVIALSLGVWGVKSGLFFIRTAGAGLVEGPPGSFLEANNAIGVALAMNVAFLVYLARLEHRRWLARTMRVMAILSYPAVVGTASRGAWLGLALISILMLVAGAVGRVKAIATVLMLLLAASVFSLSVPDNVADRYDRLVNYEEDASAQSRFWNWSFCGTVGLNRPALGAGFAFYSLEAYARFMPEFLEQWPGKVWSCHNMYLSVLAEHGFIGLALWLTLLLSCLRGAWRMRATPGEGALRWVPVYGEMIQVALLGYIFMGWFLDFQYFEVYYQLIGVVIVAKEILRHRTAPEGPALAPAGMALPFRPQSRRS